MSQTIRYEGTEHVFPDDFTEADISAALQQPTEQPAQKGILARSYDAVGQAGSDLAVKGHELATPIRQLASNLNSRLPESLQDKDLNIATPEDVAGTGRVLAQDVLLPSLVPFGLGRLGRIGAGAAQAGPRLTGAAQTAGQVTGGAGIGAGAGDEHPVKGALVGGLAGAIPGVAPALGRAIAGGVKGAVQAAPRALENIWGGPIVKDAIKGAWRGLRGQPSSSPLANMGPPASAGPSVPPAVQSAPAAAQPAPFNPARVGMSAEQFARLSPAAQAEITRQAGTATVTRPAQPGMVTPTGQASAGASGQPSSLLERTLQSVRPAQSVQSAPSALPITRPHVRGEQIQNVPPPGPGKPTIRVVNPPTLQPSGTAEILRQDPTLKSALESFEWAKKMHQKGFRLGGKVR